MYDDFDGNGNLQTFDNQNLAVAGSLSSKIWHSYAGSEIVLDPAASKLFSIVNENGQRVEYGLQEGPVREIITYLAENPRPIVAFEREVLEGLLNDRGKTVVADIEVKELEKQAKVIQYILNKRRELFNDRGRKLIATLTDNMSSILTQERFHEWIKQGFDENELFVLSRLVVEKKVYENFRNSAVRTAWREGESLVRAVTGLRKELQEIKYVFDAQGKLVDAVPHIQGQPYQGSEKLLWLCARDGYYETGNGLVPVEKGKVYGVARVVPTTRSGYVLMITNSLQDDFTRCILSNPEAIDFVDSKSFSADVMLSSASTSRSFSAGLDYHTTIPEQPPGKSWYAGIVIIRNAHGNITILGQYSNVNMGIFVGDNLGAAQLDKWYNLRLDIVTKREDSSLKDNELRLDYYVDGALKASRIPEDSEILIDPERTGWGPQRSFVVDGEKGIGNCIGYFDNVRAVYMNRVG